MVGGIAAVVPQSRAAIAEPGARTMSWRRDTRRRAGGRNDPMANDSLVAETARRIFADACDPQTVNRAPDSGWMVPAWSALEEAGLPLAWVPEKLGGSGAGVADGFAVLREAGRAAVPLPVAETLLAGWLLAQAGITVPRGALSCGPARDRDSIVLAGNGTLNGLLRAVPFARGAGHLAVLAEREAGGVAVALVEAGSVHVADGRSLAGDALNAVRFENARPAAVRDMPPGVDAGVLMLMGAATRAMQMAGALEAILDLSVAYANERVAFGRPIGKFQAVQQSLARLAGEVAAAIAAAGSAADAIAGSPSSASGGAGAAGSPPPLWGRDRVGGNPQPPTSGVPPPLTPPHKGEGNPVGASFDEGVLLEVASAKIRVGEAAGEGAAIAHQVLGAIGFTQEHVLHRYTRRLWAWRDDFGSESVWAVKLGHLVAAKGADALWPMLAAR
jgi:alkylation response protein AidB-like acyl-CoA dehydrogenase